MCALVEAGIESTRVFVPPFNRFDAAQYPMLADALRRVCGGPESVALMGFHGGPLWREGAVYLPCYAPLYADARTVLAVAERLIEWRRGHLDPDRAAHLLGAGRRLRALRRLAERIAPFAASWEELLAEIDADRARPGAADERGVDRAEGVENAPARVRGSGAPVRGAARAPLGQEIADAGCGIAQVPHRVRSTRCGGERARAASAARWRQRGGEVAVEPLKASTERARGCWASRVSRPSA